MYSEDNLIVITLTDGSIDSISCQSNEAPAFVVIDHDLPEPSLEFFHDIKFADELPEEDRNLLEGKKGPHSFLLRRENDR